MSTINDLIGSRLRVPETAPFAYFSDEKALTAAELDGRATHFAHRLAQLGIGRGSRVILVAPNGSAALASLVACWKVGALVCPADVFLSGKAFATLTLLFRPALVILDPALPTKAGFAAACAEQGCRAIEPTFDAPVGEPPALTRPGPDDGALCIFTSGSTGKPKGVPLTHANLVAGTNNLLAAKKLTARDRAFCVLPISHINGLVTTFLAPLASGGSVFYWQRPFDAREALEHLDRHECTWFSAIPTHYATLMSPPVEKKHWSLKSLRFCRSAAAPLSAKLLEEFEQYYGVPVIETMGMTECAGQIFANPLPPARHKPGSVGLPVGFEARIVADDGHVCGDDEPGEIQLRGPALMAGYLDSPDETSKAIEGGWLKSGDIGRRDDEGYHFITGRKKDIAIFSGVNVALRTLEAALEANKGLLSVACVGEPHPIFGETITVYAVGRDAGCDHKRLATELSDALFPLLPSRQALKCVRFVARFPRSGAGKVLKGKFKDEPLLYESTRALPSTPRELLAEVLGLAPERITPELTRGLIPEWNSLAQVTLLVAVETVLNRKLSRAEMGALRTYRGLEQVLGGEPLTTEAGASAGQKARAKELLGRLAAAGFGASPVNYLILTHEACLKAGVDDTERLVDTLLESLPSGQTLVMNAFTWAFYGTKTYHHLNSPCETGIIGEVFRRTTGVVRGNHPVYSYAAFGPAAAALVTHEGPTSWGEGSTTAKLLEAPDVRVLTLGVPILKGSPAIHALEERFRVPYRFLKTFEGTVDFGKGPQRYSTQTFVRQEAPVVSNDWTPIQQLMESRRLLSFQSDPGLLSYRNRDLRAVAEELLSQDLSALIASQQ